MKKSIFYFITILFCQSLFSQSTYYQVSGKVIDMNTKLPLQGASVFAQNTTLGTTADANGSFTLRLPNGGYDLVVTYTGYQTEARRISAANNGNHMTIELKQQEKSMAEVAIRSTSEVKDGWAKYGSFFTENFIGNTLNSKHCIIKNKDSLRFFYYKRKNRLKVIANSPVEIENNALGYVIKYALDSFAYDYNTNACIYTGFPLFEEMVPISEDQKILWQSNRKKAYEGSLLQLMRNIYDEDLYDDEFEIQLLDNNDDSAQAIVPEDVYEALGYNKDDSTQTVKITPGQKELAIIYKKEKPDNAYIIANPKEPVDFQLSYLFFTGSPSVIIEQNGYFYEQSDVSFNGWMAWEKIADMLPYDFIEK